jgi:uncharacterized membrane protein YsdA (DUF1294 family)
MEKYYALIYAAFIFIMSLIAFILYSADKQKAKRGAWRIPEAVLLNFGIFGGAVGALLGMKAFRHKTKHWYFWVVNILGLLWQAALPVLYILFKQGII